MAIVLENFMATTIEIKITMPSNYKLNEPNNLLTSFLKWTMVSASA